MALQCWNMNVDKTKISYGIIFWKHQEDVTRIYASVSVAVVDFFNVVPLDVAEGVGLGGLEIRDWPYRLHCKKRSGSETQECDQITVHD